MPTISIQATDTLFFRDGRPFSMGDDSFAQGVFPPPPGVVYGALRAACLSKGLEEDASLEGLVEASECLSFRFIALQSDSSSYFPLPLDLIVPKPKGEKGGLKARPLLLNDKPAYSKVSTPKILRSTYDGKTVDEPKLLEILALERYLFGEVANLNVRKCSDFICAESKIGIGRDRDSRIATDGKLFRILANRMASDSNNGVQHLRFLISLEGLDISEKGWLALGGERRAAFYQVCEPVEIPLPEIDTPQFKIYLATPAVFEHGWMPDNLLKQYGLTLLAAALDRPAYVGGWEMRPKGTPDSGKRSSQPKPMLQCVPAGSVYYVQADSTTAAQAAAQAIHGNAISDNLNQTDYCKQGFGIAYVGKISVPA
jgi:CRISPR-associated protein Cmr3